MNAKELGDMPAFPLPVIKDDQGRPMAHGHPYNQGMTVRDVATLAFMMIWRHTAVPERSENIALMAERDADALLALLAKDTE